LTRIMGDSVEFGVVPKSVDIVAVYANGHFGVVSPAELEAQYPHSRYGHVFIDVDGSRPDAQVRDWENGDKGGSLEAWVIEHNLIAGRKDAVVYCNRSTIPEVRRLSACQVLGRDYYLWVATLDGEEVTGPGIVACQKDGADQTGADWDRSLVYDNAFWRATGSPHRPKPDCREFQAAVHVVPDGLWGPNTDKHSTAVIQASRGQFPFGVEFAQEVVRTLQDGIWGPKSKGKLRDTVFQMQVALSGMGYDTHGFDGHWDADSQDAWNAAREACHI
jgi:hypothetical protein